MKIAILTLGVALAAKTAVAAPNPTIDSRAAALFEKVKARYKSLKSFSVVGHETFVGGGRTRFERVETALQFPYRARLRVDSTDANGKITLPRTRRLIGAKSYQTWDLVSAELAPNSSQFTALGSDKARAKALKNIYLPTVDLALSVFTITAGGNPTKMQNLQRVSIQKTRESNTIFDVITLVRQDKGDPNPITLEYFVSPRREISKFVVRRKVDGQNFVVTTRFDALQPNWKGSQSATDAAVYGWKTIALSGIDAPAPRPKAVVGVDPEARQIFARAAKLYGELKGLQLEIRKTDVDPQYGTSTETTKLAYDADGRLRLETPDGLSELLVIGDKTKTTLDKELDFDDKGNDKSKLTYKIEPIDAEDAIDEINSELETAEFDLGPLSSWLRKENPLEAENVETQVDVAELREFRAAVLPSQNFEGQLCDIVRVTTRFDDKYTTARGETTKQETFWFAPDGRLVRIQTRSQEGNQKPETHDWQMKAQEFNPKFDEKTFAFTPPPGAIRAK